MNRIPTYGIEVFLTIVREGSMRAAAESLGVGAPAITLQLKALEEKLGVDLLHRTTRSVELTEAGRTLFDAASPAYRDLVEAVQKTQQISRSTTGTLRLSMSRGAYVNAISPVMDEFLAKHPGISFDISWNEELVDVVRKGYHAGIRMGDYLRPEMIAVRITGKIRSAYFAAPSYLKKNGRPKSPIELLEHQCIRYREPTSGNLRNWWVVEDGQRVQIDPPPYLVFDTVSGVIQAAVEGHGIGWSMYSTMQSHLKNNELELALEPFAEALPPFYIYYPEQNRRVECLRLFVDFLKEKQKQLKAY
ncbi:MAG: LysR family transcriptional regulator [Pseudomonadota bacterium]